MLRFSNLLLLFFVLVAVIGSPFSAFGCRTFIPEIQMDLEAPCSDVNLVSGEVVSNFLDYTPTLISIVSLVVLMGKLNRWLLPLPAGCVRKPLLPPPRFV